MALFGLAGVKLVWLTRDPHQVAKLAPYYGILSNVGVLFWCSIVAVAIFCAILLSDRSDASGLRACMVWLAVLTFVLMADDLFMIHDWVLPHVFGLTKARFKYAAAVPYAFYGAGHAWFYSRYRRFILEKTEYRLLGLALILFAASVLADMGILGIGTGEEDALKLFGIITYAYYWWLICRQIMREHAVAIGVSQRA